MEPIGEQPPPLYDEFRALLPEGANLTMLERFSYYDAARSRDVALVIATGDPRLAVNILLTIGVIHPST
jgi:L-fucose mutarotase